MRIRLATAVIIVFSVLFVGANLIALPFANFGTYSALWAQVYGNSQPNIPTCSLGSPYFVRLSDADAEHVSIPFPPPTSDSKLEAVYLSDCFGINTVALSEFAKDGLTCDNVVAYRIEDDGNRQLWPITCDATKTNLLIPGTGLRGHIQLFKIGDPADAPAGIPLSHGA